MKNQTNNCGNRHSGSVSRAASFFIILFVILFANISESKAQQGWGNSVGNWAGNQVRNYYQNRGAYCPPAPPFMPSYLRPAYHIGTCAYRAY